MFKIIGSFALLPRLVPDFTRFAQLRPNHLNHSDPLFRPSANVLTLDRIVSFYTSIQVENCVKGITFHWVSTCWKLSKNSCETWAEFTQFSHFENCCKTVGSNRGPTLYGLVSTTTNFSAHKRAQTPPLKMVPLESYELPRHAGIGLMGVGALVGEMWMRPWGRVDLGGKKTNRHSPSHIQHIEPHKTTSQICSGI